jgi:hypothetical protein
VLSTVLIQDIFLLVIEVDRSHFNSRIAFDTWHADGSQVSTITLQPGLQQYSLRANCGYVESVQEVLKQSRCVLVNMLC